MYHPRQPMDRKMMREMNQNMLLNLIRTHAPVSRTQLKDLSGLSMATVVGITTTLIEQQLVIETGVAESTGGRKAGLLEIHPEGGYGIGIEVREHEIIGAVLNLRGDVVYEEIWPTLLRDNSVHAVDIISRGVDEFIDHARIPFEKILGLGCGISGPVNAHTGVNIDSWILNWHDVELAQPLSERLNMPVFVDNSVNCLASYQKLYGEGQKFHNFLLVTLGRGLGLACVIRDDLFRGAEGIGAEFGHIPLLQENRRCECGNTDCLEAYVSDHGILATYYKLTSSATHSGENLAVTANELVAQAEQGDKQAQLAFDLTGTYLGAGLATLVNLFNPQCLIITCENRGWLERLQLCLEQTMRQHIFSQLGDQLQFILQSNTPMINWARGAGCLVLRDFFSLFSTTQEGVVGKHNNSEVLFS